MIISIIQNAVARKMLCNPTNNLITETELCCAIGMACNLLKLERETVDILCKEKTINALYTDFLKAIEKLKMPSDLPSENLSQIQNLLQMIRIYRLEEKNLTEKLIEILYYGYENPIVFPKGKF